MQVNGRVGWTKARDVLVEVVAVLFKAALALAIFTSVLVIWGWWQVRQAQAMSATQALPNDIGGQNCSVWFVGSSTMNRWSALQQDMSPWTTHNRSIGGATLAELSQRFQNEHDPRPPRAIVFYAGENDIAFGVSPDVVTATFDTFMARKTAKLGGVPVIFVSVKPSPTRWGDFASQTAYNTQVKAMAARRSDLTFVDLTSSMLKDGRPGPFYTEDGIHMNPAGYRIWTPMVRAALRAELPRAVVDQCDPQQTAAR